MMYYRLIQLLILGYYIIHSTESIFIYNLTNTEKILCYSCKGNICEKINDNEDNMIVCNKNTQLCWAGFVDQQPYRTCASRYCTPSGISLDSDIRIETCCRSNLCNSVTLAWSIWSKLYQKSTSQRPGTSAYPTTVVTTKRTTTTAKKTSGEPQMYIVNEIDNKEGKPSLFDSDEEQLSNLKFNLSDPASYGINWDRIPYDRDFSNRVASISTLLIFLMPALLVLLF